MAIQRPYVHGSSHRSVESFFLWRGHVSAGVYATAASTLCWSCPADARSDAATISALPNVGKFPPIMKCDPVFDPKTICRFDAATMSMDRAILLISDRPDRSQELARRLGRPLRVSNDRALRTGEHTGTRNRWPTIQLPRWRR